MLLRLHDILFLGHILRKYNAKCKSDESYLNTFSSLEECSEACRKEEGCTFFVFGYSDAFGQCYKEFTNSSACTEGWEDAPYNFYELLGKPCIVTLRVLRNT